MEILSNFSERLKEMLEERGMAAPVLAQQIGIDRTNVTRYLRGERLPNFHSFCAIVEFFGCSADFLLGLEEFPPDKQYAPVAPFAETFRRLLQATGTSQYALEHALHLSGAIVYSWLAGRTSPSVEHLVQLAKYFSCSVDCLLGREQSA